MMRACIYIFFWHVQISKTHPSLGWTQLHFNCNTSFLIKWLFAISRALARIHHSTHHSLPMFFGPIKPHCQRLHAIWSFLSLVFLTPAPWPGKTFIMQVGLDWPFTISSQSGMTILGLPWWHLKFQKWKFSIFDPDLKNPSQSGMNLTSLLLQDFTFIFHPLVWAKSLGRGGTAWGVW